MPKKGVQVVGLVGARIGYNGWFGQLTALIVDATSRGTGIGTALVRAAEAWIRAQEAVAIAVNSGKHRHDAHGFYEHLGYKANGVRFMKTL